MDHPSVRSLMEAVKKINQIAQRADSCQSGVEGYLQAITADPMTEWFTDLLREQNEELQRQEQRADQLACALRAWYRAKHGGVSEAFFNEVESQLIDLLHEMEIISQSTR